MKEIDVELKKLIEFHLKLAPMNFVDIFTDNLHVWIESLSSSDRGKFKVGAEHVEIGVGHIDAADMFPRYYYNFDAMIIELNQFFISKKQEKLNKVEFKMVSIEGNIENAAYWMRCTECESLLTQEIIQHNIDCGIEKEEWLCIPCEYASDPTDDGED